MCDELACGREHVPPKCFFPEIKDLGKDYRINLIKVPSCDKHNSKTCKDDEYVLGVVAFHWRNNPIAYDLSLEFN
jgi:hypothetical protein